MTAMQSESIAALMPALVKAAKAFTPALKSASNPHFNSRFAALDNVLDAVRPALLDQGIVIVQPTRVTDAGRAVLATRLVHTSGEWIGGEYPINPVQSNPQAEGSALTYARRYSVLALCGIAPEDDDGEAGSAPQRGAQSQQKARQQQPEPRPFDDPDPLNKLIDVATTKAELAEVANKIGAAWLPDGDMDRLRAHYRERVAELGFGGAA